MNMLPACLKDHVAMLGQRQDPVLILGACVLSHRESQVFQHVWDRRDRSLPPYVLLESSWLQVSRLRVCASLCSLCPLLAPAG